MKNNKVIKCLCFFNLTIILLLILDSFIFLTIHVTEELESSHYLQTRGKNYNYWTYQLVAKSGNKYEFSDQSGIALDDNSTFYIQKSRLFGLPLAIYFQLENKHYRADVSILQMNYIVQGVILIVLGFSLYNLLNKNASQNAKRNLIAMSIFFYGGMVYLIIYQWHIT